MGNYADDRRRKHSKLVEEAHAAAKLRAGGGPNGLLHADFAAAVGSPARHRDASEAAVGNPVDGSPLSHSAPVASGADLDTRLAAAAAAASRVHAATMGAAVQMDKACGGYVGGESHEPMGVCAFITVLLLTVSSAVSYSLTDFSPAL